MIKKIGFVACSVFALTWSTVLPASSPVIIQNVPVINQLPELPTGCELTALAMLLQYNGFDYSKTQVADSTRRTSVPVSKNGVWYGEHPNDYFIGSPYSKHAYGTYAPNVARTLDKLAPGRSLNLSGKEFNDVLKMVDEGQPVVMWMTIDLKSPKQTRVWQTPSGKFQWTAPEHAVLVVGYDEDYIYANDPLTGKRESYPRSVFESRWNSLGKQAITMTPAFSKIGVVFKGMPIEVTESQKALKYNNNVWVPLRTFQKLDPTIELIPNGFTPSTPILRINGKPLILETGALSGLVVKLIDGTNYVNIDFINKHLGTSHVVIESELRLF